MQRGCDACPDIDAKPRVQVGLASGGLALYHLTCRPKTAHDTSDLHTAMVQQVHAREQDTGRDAQGFDLGSKGEIRSSGAPVTPAEMLFNDRPIAEVSAELYAAEEA